MVNVNNLISPSGGWLSTSEEAQVGALPLPSLHEHIGKLPPTLVLLRLATLCQLKKKMKKLSCCSARCSQSGQGVRGGGGSPLSRIQLLLQQLQHTVISNYQDACYVC